MNEDFFNKWALITGIVQVLDYNLNTKQISNDKLFEELQKQDSILENQNKNYLEKIILQNEKIIKLLTRK